MQYLAQSKTGLLHMTSMAQHSDDIIKFVPDDENEPTFRGFVEILQEIASCEIRLISKSELQTCFTHDEPTIVEQRLIRDLTKFVNSNISIDLFVFAADSLLASSAIKGMPLSPLGLKASFKFRKYFSQVEFQSVWLPESIQLSLSHFAGHPTSKFSHIRFKSLCSQLLLKLANQVDDPNLELLIDKDYTILGISGPNPMYTKDYVDKAQLICDTNNFPPNFLVKLHPNSNVLQLSLPTNLHRGYSNDALHSYPLEIFLNARDGNAFIGDLTGSVVYTRPNKVSFLDSNSEMKVHYTYYKKFLSLWANSPSWTLV